MCLACLHLLFLLPHSCQSLRIQNTHTKKHCIRFQNISPGCTQRSCKQTHEWKSLPKTQLVSHSHAQHTHAFWNRETCETNHIYFLNLKSLCFPASQTHECMCFMPTHFHSFFSLNFSHQSSLQTCPSERIRAYFVGFAWNSLFCTNSIHKEMNVLLPFYAIVFRVNKDSIRFTH